MKKFDAWNTYKQELQRRKSRGRVSVRDVWWCSLGVNVGYEQDGKGRFFSRPVLVLREINRHVFVGIPLSTKIKPNSPFHVTVTFQGREVSALILQIRTLSTRRLEERLGRFSKGDFRKVKRELSERLDLEMTHAELTHPVLAKLEGGNGRLFIPADAREALGWPAGEAVMLWVEEGELHMREGDDTKPD